MSAGRHVYRGGVIFDGDAMIEDQVLIIEDGRMSAILPEGATDLSAAQVTDLGGDILCPGYVDLQVNGGGGVMFNDDQSVEALRCIAGAHAQLGATTIFPTLITDTPERTRAAIEAVRQAIAEGVPGIGGLHLEGPHLSLARKGAHDPSMIRPMTDRDLEGLVEAARTLPALMVTLAPEGATLEQVSALASAGAIVSLGHSDATFETCIAYQAAGARCVTHLFNAMSQLGNRAPGLVGAALDSGGLAAGLIADGIHVHPASIRAALAAKAGPGEVFLVSDAMALAGTDRSEFVLNGREIRRQDGRLTLADGTLAGADLDLTTAIGVMARDVGIPLERALRMATVCPARIGGQPAAIGRLAAGKRCPLLRLATGKSMPILRQVIRPESDDREPA